MKIIQSQMKKLSLFILLYLLANPLLKGQEDRFKALFIYNFTKNITWPVEKKQGDFIIGVFGSSPIIPELKKIAATKNAGNQPIIVRRFSSLNQIDYCHILFLPAYKSGSLEDVLNLINHQASLLITEKNNMIQRGAGINFIILKNGNLLFEISPDNIKKHQLIPGKTLLELGIIIE